MIVATAIPDIISELIGLRAWVLNCASEVECIGELPARQRGAKAVLIANQMRAAIMADHLVKACKRPARAKQPFNELR